ncbi:unnamed protein product, partial [Ixodes hexagonus]
VFQTFHELDQERYIKYGNLYGMFEGGKPSLFVADPELIKQVLVKDFLKLPNRRSAEFYNPLLDNMMSVVSLKRWKVIRSVSTPAFSSAKLQKMCALIESCVGVTTSHLIEAAEKNEDVELNKFYGNYTLDVIARCAFGTTVDSHSDQTNEFVAQTKKIFGGKSLTMILLFVFPALAKLLKLKIFDEKAVAYYKALSSKTMETRRGTQTRKDDFLQLMVDAQERNRAPDVSACGEEDNVTSFDLDSKLTDEAPLSSKTLSEDEALAQCMMFILAGHGTTSSVVAFCVYLLALNPDAQETLRKEVDECFKEHGPQPSMAVIDKLPYLHGVISEGLRMFPPASRLERETTEDYVLGNTGIKVPKGCVVAVPVWAIHHDPQYFPDPYSFRPERFSEENINSIPPYVYLPFGAGPRNCIGMRLGLRAVKMVLMHSVHNAEFVRTEKTKVPLDLFKGFGVIGSANITVGVRNRAP